MSRFLPPVVLVALVGVCTWIGWQGAGVGDPALIKIVSSLPRTGSAKAQTDTIVNGIKIALAEADSKAGGFEIAYADWDDATAGAGQWTAEAETANAARAVRDPDVMIYIGTYNSGAAKISMPILNKAHLLMISPANTWPGLTKPDKGD
ncbi:MAG TPA: branched-chain amino acid ABC transporter substrate-binding protein, partial [Pirellulales bacterium]|nr:branched-chain amino acid ABC transporter substrate-binding protein [Pirellulales bacterium]